MKIEVVSVYKTREKTEIRAKIELFEIRKNIEMLLENQEKAAENREKGNKNGQRTPKRANIDRDVILKIIETEKQNIAQYRPIFDGAIFLDMVLLKSEKATEDGEKIPLFNRKTEQIGEISVDLIPNDSITAVKSLILMNESLFAVINEEISLPIDKYICAEIYIR